MSLQHQIGRQIYFIGDEHGRVKIGHALDMQKRLSGLQTSCADNLSILRLIDGGEPTERWLHRRFAEAHIRGEWFRFLPEMLSILPPDEIPVPRVVKRRLKLSLKETLEQHDDYPFINEDKLLAAYLVTSFDDDDSAAFIAWVRARTGANPNQHSSAPTSSTERTDTAGETPRPVSPATNSSFESSVEGVPDEVAVVEPARFEGEGREVATSPLSGTGDEAGKQNAVEANERCNQPASCKFANHPHKITCSDCSSAWQVARKREAA